jgi:uncharacterized SAM-binding protein YcdF (DUF218 family)
MQADPHSEFTTMTVPQRRKTALLWAALAICGAAIIGAIEGRVVLEKIALRVLTPVGLLWLALTCQTLWCWTHRRWPAGLWSAGLWAAVTLLGNGALEGALMARVERPIVQADPLAGPAYDALIVLGGGSSMGPAGRPQLNQAGDRLVLAAQMYHAGKARRLICTGQRIRELNPEGRDPAEQSQQILESLGIPRSAIEHRGGRNTAEEFQQIGQAGLPSGRIGLLTSAWHMPRAMRLARANGVTVEPVPADFQGAHEEGERRSHGPGALVLSLIPTAEALSGHALLWKELLALLVGR